MTRLNGTHHRKAVNYASVEIRLTIHLHHLAHIRQATAGTRYVEKTLPVA